MKTYETFEIAHNRKSLGLKFVQTIDAPEDYVKIHPFQVAKLLNNANFDISIDILAGDEGLVHINEL